MNLKKKTLHWLRRDRWKTAPGFGSITIKPRRVIDGKFKFMNFPSIIDPGVDGLLTPIGNPDGMAATISQALNLPSSEYGKFTSSGLKKLKDNFSEEAIVQRYIDFYSALLTDMATRRPKP